MDEKALAHPVRLFLVIWFPKPFSTSLDTSEVSRFEVIIYIFKETHTTPRNEYTTKSKTITPANENRSIHKRLVGINGTMNSANKKFSPEASPATMITSVNLPNLQLFLL